MVQAVTPERQLLTEALEREFGNALRMLKAYPAERLDDRPADCPRSGREMAWALVERERRMHYVLCGPAAGLDAHAPESLAAILAAYESAHHETRAALTPAQWREPLHGPVGMGPWERARRGELLWMAWKDLVHHAAHLAVHLRLARQDDAAARGDAAAESTAVA